MAQSNPYDSLVQEFDVEGQKYKFFDFQKLGDVSSLPYSIRILLESAVRNCDEYVITKKHVETILDWTNQAGKAEVPFKPARVLLQDFTGVPSVVDLAAMRDAVKDLGGNPDVVNPAVPVDLVVDHSVQIDYFGTEDSFTKNLDKEMERNHERFQFLKWGAKAFQNFRIVPPGSGIVHQVNLEYLARAVFASDDGVCYPDSLVGTDSHTTMIDGLGVAGWGVGGIEAESVMMGSAVTMVLPEVVGFRFTGELPAQCTATDLVLTVTQMLRQLGVVGKFVEFFGPGMASLSLADRATIANMAPEYGATMGFFPVDKNTVDYLRMSSRPEHTCQRVEAYLRAAGMFVDHAADKPDAPTPAYSAVLELDLADVTPSISGPKRPHDRIATANMKEAWGTMLGAKVGFKGFGLSPDEQAVAVPVEIDGESFTLTHGSVVIASITSCTNTSNPSVMLGAGMIAERALARGLKVPKFVKTSLAPGSPVVREYLAKSGLQTCLNQLGFNIVAFGCTTCIGNSGDLVPAAAQAIESGKLVAASVLSGNRNFEGRVHSDVRASFLASPMLVVAYALAGTVNIDFTVTPLGTDADGKPVFLSDIWPSSNEIQEVVSKNVLRESFGDVYKHITDGTPAWRALEASDSKLYPWSDESTYIHQPPFFTNMGKDAPGSKAIKDAFVLVNVGDSITTDHISPAGRIARDSPAARYLVARGVEPKDFNTYGARRGNDEVMARGTFANTRLVNKFLPGEAGPNTVHIPSGDKMAIFDAADRYMKDGKETIILAGRMYGSGSSRDWAAKGPMLQGVKAVIAISYERIHRSNLVGMGIVPLEFLEGEDADSLGLTGKENFTLDFETTPLGVGAQITVQYKGDGHEGSFQAVMRIDTAIEVEYIKHGGILHYTIRQLAK